MTTGATLNMREFVRISVTGNNVVALRDHLPTTSRWGHALIGVSGGAIRWLSISDKEPSATDGSYVGAGGTIDWTNTDNDYRSLIYNAKFVKAGANNAELEVQLAW